MTVQERNASAESGFHIRDFFKYFKSKTSSSGEVQQAGGRDQQAQVVEAIRNELQERIAAIAKTIGEVEVPDLPKTDGKLSLIMFQAENTIKAIQKRVGEGSKVLVDSLRSYCRQAIAAAAEKIEQRYDAVTTLAECQTVVDTMLFLARNNLAEACEIINGENPAKVAEEKALEYMNMLKEKLDGLREQQDAYKLQSGATTYANEVALVMSGILDTDQGLALGLCPLVKQVFIPENQNYLWGDSRSSYETYLELQLQKLVDLSTRSPEHFKNLQQQYLMVQKPRCKMPEVDLLIRATLALDGNEEITAAHARICALGDYFRQPRQQETGTCFEERQQIWTQMNRPDIGFTDDKNIFEVGGMVRTIDGKQKIFRFSDQIADYDLENEYHVVANNGILHTSYDDESSLYIWDAPGVKKALKVVGIRLSDELKESAMAKLMSDDSADYSIVNVLQVLNAFVDAWKGLVPADKRDSEGLKYACYFVFSAQTHFPLQRVKMDMIAQMTQAHTGGFLNRAVDSCVSKALNDLGEAYSRNHEEPSKERWMAAAYLANMFVRTFSEMRFWTYENLGDVDDRKSDGEANHGQWVLRGNDGTLKGGRMDSPEVFQAFLSRVVDTAWKNTNAVELPGAISEVAKEVFDHMKAQIETTEFVKRCFVNYNPAENNIEDPLGQWHELDHTPIRDKEGGMTAAVVDDYFGVALPIMTQFKPESARDAMVQTSQFYREQTQKDPDAFKAAWPMDIPGHAVNFWPDKRMRHKKIVENLEKYGRMVANQPMPADMADEVRSSCFKLIEDKEAKQAARQEFRASLASEETIGTYCKKLLDAILNNTADDLKSINKTKVCNTVLANLPRSEDQSKNLFMLITRSAVRVFDLDWGGVVYQGPKQEKPEAHAVFGKFYFDPTLGEIQLGGVGDDCGYIYSIQDEFLGNPGQDTWGAFAGSKELLEIDNPAVIKA